MKKRILLLAAWATFAGAQEVTDNEAAPDAAPPQFAVEVIIFAYTENTWVGTEIFLPDPPPPGEEPLFDERGNPVFPQQGTPEYGDSTFNDAGPNPDDEQDVPPRWIVVPDLGDEAPGLTVGRPGDEAQRVFRLALLREEDYQLGNVVDRFERLDAYETLMHFGWTQPAYSEEETPPIELSLFAEPPPGLDGTLTLYLGRFLHLVVDIALDAPAEFDEEIVEDEEFYRFDDQRTGFEDGSFRTVMPVRFRIQEDRIVKRDELRYFDHPKFGMLAKVSRVEVAEENAIGETSVDESVQ